ncbi:NUDIX hydrolase [Breznakiella homolactica]|uniref:NUDIX domain-containing protein n=1 Tax=Breznakiella homolactica TaxID=2798577 RepID=A0A7T7XPX3_9SPIR|nr:NUDIX domain-containing protein [Breznakiella homolactica]QQO10330.1 NUDIX domain-containing protein [Breznakiella homolactica]
MFTFCPSCASRNIRFENNKVFSCPDCGFLLYHNTAAATGCVISSGGRILVLVRNREPSKGKYDFPGGFVDPGEGALDGLRRECREEIGWDPGSGVTLFASFPNTYPYKGFTYNTCDLFFTIDVPGLSESDLRLDDENAAVQFVRPETISPDDMAFDSTRRALAAYLELGQNGLSGNM